MSKKKDRPATQRELDTSVQMAQIQASTRVKLYLGKWFFIAVMAVGISLSAAWALQQTTYNLAGLTTKADINLNLVLTVAFSVSAVLNLALGGMTYRYWKLHRTQKQRLAARVSALEKRIDPGKKSSRLTNGGITPTIIPGEEQ